MLIYACILRAHTVVIVFISWNDKNYNIIIWTCKIRSA